MPPVGFRIRLLMCGLGVGSYCVAALVTSPGADLPRHVAWYLISFASYLIAVALVLQHDGSEDGACDSFDLRGPRRLAASDKDRACKTAVLRSEVSTAISRGRRIDLALILGLALFFRAMLLATTPSLSDDLFRYVWDGKLLNNGIDPHLYPPSAPELAQFRSPLWEGINHKTMATPYPPLAEALFAAVYRVAPESLRAMQLMAVFFDLGAMVLISYMLARAGFDARRVLVYGWNPLVLVQFAHSGHYDAAMILPLFGAIFLLSTDKKWASGLLLGLAVLVKLAPAVAAPLFLPYWGIAGLAVAGATVAIGLAPWLLGNNGLSGLLSEASDARFNDSIGYLLYKMLGLVVADPDSASRGLAGCTVAVAAISLAGFLWLRRSDWLGVLFATYWLLGLSLLFNAVVEPWYLTWIVPFLCFVLKSDSRKLPRLDPALGWLLMSGFVILTDLTYSSQFGPAIWIWIRIAEYGPLYALILLAAYRRIGRVQPKASLA